MAELAVIAAFEARLAAGFNAAPIIGINSGVDTPKNGDPFVTIQFPLVNTEQMVLSRVYQEEGAARFVISVARGLKENLQLGLTWSAQISSLFRTQKFDGVQTWAPTSGRLDDENEDGNYYVMTVVVPYTYNFRG